MPYDDPWLWHLLKAGLSTGKCNGFKKKEITSAPEQKQEKRSEDRNMRKEVRTETQGQSVICGLSETVVCVKLWSVVQTVVCGSDCGLCFKLWSVSDCRLCQTVVCVKMVCVRLWSVCQTLV